MKKILLGTLRSIELFDANSDPDLVGQWQNFIEKIVFKGERPLAFTPFGSVNEMHPLILDPVTSHILVFDPLAGSTLLIARSPNEFDYIITEVLEVWKGHQHLHMISRNKEVMEKYTAFIEKIKAIPEIDITWWINYAFKELNVRFLL